MEPLSQVLSLKLNNNKYVIIRIVNYHPLRHLDFSYLISAALLMPNLHYLYLSLFVLIH